MVHYCQASHPWLPHLTLHLHTIPSIFNFSLSLSLMCLGQLASSLYVYVLQNPIYSTLDESLPSSIYPSIVITNLSEYVLTLRDQQFSQHPHENGRVNSTLHTTYILPCFASTCLSLTLGTSITLYIFSLFFLIFFG